MLPYTSAVNAASRSKLKAKLSPLAKEYGHQCYFDSSSGRTTTRLEDHSMQETSLQTARIATEATQSHGTTAQKSTIFCIETPQRVRVRVNDPLLQSFFNVECKHSSATPDYIQRFRCILMSKWTLLSGSKKTRPGVGKESHTDWEVPHLVVTLTFKRHSSRGTFKRVTRTSRGDQYLLSPQRKDI